MDTIGHVIGHRGGWGGGSAGAPVLDAGLGIELQGRGYLVGGQQTTGQFQRLRFSEQIELIADEFCTQFRNPDAQVVAGSFGPHLFLSAPATLQPFPGNVLLFACD